MQDICCFKCEFTGQVEETKYNWLALPLTSHHISCLFNKNTGNETLKVVLKFQRATIMDLPYC